MDLSAAALFLRHSAGEALPYLRTHLLVWPVAAQLGAAILAWVVMRTAGLRLADRLAARAARLRPSPLNGLIHAAIRVVPWLLLLGVIWIAEAILLSRGQRVDLLRLVASLSVAWIVIRLTSRLVADPQVARAVALLAWLVAALNIAGLLGSTEHLLDSVSVNLGTLRLSPLLVLRGAVMLAVLLWAAGALSRLAEHRLARAPHVSPSVQVLAVKLTRIALFTLAVVLALGAIGIDLTAFAVFSGAIGVGLGFGLQKVVSNLVSGVILLLDRSIKPGDVIQLGDTYGWIASLNARFVSVATRDGVEHLIPNEDLITERVVNWSYSNDLVRLRVSFGVAYESDPRQVMRLAIDAARQTARVLAEPKPICLLRGFGDSSVDFELRFWIRDPRNGTANVESDVLLAVWDRLQAEGIELPFPQRELRLRDARAWAGLARGSAVAD
jgi:small-conductance mechanosensitive channel